MVGAIGSMTVGYVIIIVFNIWIIEAGFYFALIASVFHGAATAIGESTMLAFLRGFPSKLVGGFSSGTGMAGIAGTLLFLVFKQIDYLDKHEGFVS